MDFRDESCTLELDGLLRQGALREALGLCHAFFVERSTRNPSLDRACVVTGELFVPVIRRIESDWRADRIDIGQTMFAYFQVRCLMKLWRTTTGGDAAQPFVRGIALVTLPQPEKHYLGASILVDCLRLQGWNAELIEPVQRLLLLAKLASGTVDVVCISIGHDSGLAGAASLISEIRAAAAPRNVIILAGGAAINMSPESYDFLGADKISLSLDDGLRYLEAINSSVSAQISPSK